MKPVQIIIVILIAALAGAAGGYVAAPRLVSQTTAAQTPLSSQPATLGSVYDRVMASNTLRCGYILWPAVLVKDPNTGQFSGPWYDVVEEMGKRLGLKIEWTEEVGTANMFEGFRTGRYDALCAPLTSTPERARIADFTIPFAYIPYHLYVRKDDTRFDNNPAAANDPAIRVVTIDGEYSSKVAQDDLPKAQVISLQNMTQGSDLLLYVESGKADVAPDDGVSAADFITQHNGSLRPIAGPPLRILPVVLPIPKGEIELKLMLDATLEEMQNTGFTQKTFLSYAKQPGMYLFPAPPQAPQ
jgi:ABC-type amino acid transport substrate-binding protein